MSSEDEEDSDHDLKVLKAKKQKKKATRSKQISQKTCIAEIEEDESDSDWGPLNNLLCANNSEDSESKVVDLEEALKVKDEELQSSSKKQETINKEMISQMEKQIEMLNGQVLSLIHI